MLRGLWALALFAHLRLLDFGDGDYAWHRLLNRISNDNLDWGLLRPHFFPRYLLRPGLFRLKLRWHRLLRRFFSCGLRARAHLTTGGRFARASRRSLFPLSHDRHLSLREPRSVQAVDAVSRADDCAAPAVALLVPLAFPFPNILS